MFFIDFFPVWIFLLLRRVIDTAGSVITWGELLRSTKLAPVFKQTSTANRARTKRAQNKIVDIPTLPPCERVLFLFVKRANYIALIWKKANVETPVLPPITDHGWNEDERLTWTSEVFPEEVLFEDEFDTNDYIDDSRESDDEEDVWLSPVLSGFTIYC